MGTDHCPFNSTQKALGKHDFRKIPNGVNGKYLTIFSIRPALGTAMHRSGISAFASHSSKLLRVLVEGWLILT